MNIGSLEQKTSIDPHIGYFLRRLGVLLKHDRRHTGEAFLTPIDTDSRRELEKLLQRLWKRQ